jgi:nicotinate-nucleotide pyrophosphorylase (carboxylating)
VRDGADILIDPGAPSDAMAAAIEAEMLREAQALNFEKAASLREPRWMKSGCSSPRRAAPRRAAGAKGKNHDATRRTDPARMVAMVQAAIAEDGARNGRHRGLPRPGRAGSRCHHRCHGGDHARGCRHCVRSVPADRSVLYVRSAAPGTANAWLNAKPSAAFTARAASIVAAERTALNFMQHMSGVATLTSRFVDAVDGTGVVILDTRKTIPLWRELDKYAVRCGGAQNHRRSLDAMVLVKDNHVRALGGPQPLIDIIAARGENAGFVEVEVDSMQFLEQLLAVHVDRIMLDNFSPGQVGDALELIRSMRAARADARIEIEVSGGITLDSVRDYALPGVDYISVGALTHSAPAAPMSLSLL